VGVYYTGIRQAAGAAIGCLVVAIFLLEGPDKWKYLLVFTGLSLLVAIVGSFLFSEVLEMTQSQVDNKDYVRYLSADFFLNEYWPHWSAKLLGNGPGHGTKAYGKEIEYYQLIFGYYRSDVGIIGVYNQLGVLYVLNILFVNLKGVFKKINQSEGNYLKLFFFQGLFLILLSVGYTNPSGMVFYSIIYYLFEKVALADDKPLKPLVHSRPFRKALASQE
jgi:hypothetical protein